MNRIEITQGIQALSAENGLIQNIQLVVLGVACVMLVRAIRIHSGVNRTFAVGLTTFSFLALLREIDIRHLDVPQWSIDVTSGPIRDTWFAAVIVATLAYAVFRRADIPVILTALRRGRLPMLLWAFGFLVLSQSFEFVPIFLDRVGPHLYHYLRFGEELAELMGYALLAAGAFHLLTVKAFGE